MCDFKKQLEASIKRSRLDNGEYADKLGVSRVTVWRWLNDKHKPKPDAIGYWINKFKEIK